MADTDGRDPSIDDDIDPDESGIEEFESEETCGEEP